MTRRWFEITTALPVFMVEAERCLWQDVRTGNSINLCAHSGHVLFIGLMILQFMHLIRQRKTKLEFIILPSNNDFSHPVKKIKKNKTATVEKSNKRRTNKKVNPI